MGEKADQGRGSRGQKKKEKGRTVERGTRGSMQCIAGSDVPVVAETGGGGERGGGGSKKGGTEGVLADKDLTHLRAGAFKSTKGKPGGKSERSRRESQGWTENQKKALFGARRIEKRK